MTEDQFKTHVATNGYGEVSSAVYKPNTANDFHTHEFSAALLVTDGLFTLGLEDGPQVFAAGEWCELGAGTVHFEKTEAEGATVLFAKRTD